MKYSSRPQTNDRASLWTQTTHFGAKLFIKLNSILELYSARMKVHPLISIILVVVITFKNGHPKNDGELKRSYDMYL